MKLIKYSLTVVSIIAIVTFCSCDGNDGPTAQDLFLKKLGQTWKCTTGHVSVDGRDVTRSFSGMEITFTTDKTYTVANSVAPIWPAQGTFTLQPGDNGLFNILRDDGVLITVSELTDSSITFHLQHTSNGGRVKSISGAYEFLMKR
jgi:hypothetical protein